ncbi:MAG: hypothetical protein ACI4OR_03410 [Alphaproteobacteria bacterium]
MDNKRKNYYKTYTTVCQGTRLDWERYRVREIQKARCRQKIEFHTKNVLLQSMVSFLCVAGGIYAGSKKSIAVPLVLAPTASASCSKLATHETKRRHYKEILGELERY